MKVSSMHGLRVPVLLLLLTLLSTSCAVGPSPTDIGTLSSGGDLELAGRLHAQMREEYGAGRYRAALHLGHELIDRYTGYQELDQVYLLAAASARGLGETQQALALSSELLAARPDTPVLDDLLELRAELLLETGDNLRASAALVRLHDRAVLARDRERFRERLVAAVEPLDADALGGLRAGCGPSTLRPFLGYLWLEALLAEDRAREAGEAVGSLRAENPEDPWTTRAEQLLRDPSLAGAFDPTPPPGPEGVDALHVGVLCPLTGRYTVLGNAFYDGVEMARQQANREGWRQYALTVRDTEGDPVAAALAVRRFAAEERPIVLIGALLSGPTVAAAIEAHYAGIPLVSPAATNARIADLGPGIFQTNITEAYEAKLLATLAIDVLLKRRVAVLYPDRPEGLRSYELFATEVLNRGGELVAAQPFNVGLTDYRDPLRKVTEALPEIIYVPTDVSQTVLLGPQLEFYRAGAMILGPSAWNDPELARELGGQLERAVFPSDTALFPADWLTAFTAAWDVEHQPTEATTIARQAFLAAMLTFRTLGDEGMSRPEDLTRALAARLAVREEAELGQSAMAGSLRMFSAGGIVPFPIELYDAAFAATDSLGAAADSLAVDPLD
jgi:ABC-type branched-subunit amino acid transport system substrate-binding protein